MTIENESTSTAPAEGAPVTGTEPAPEPVRTRAPRKRAAKKTAPAPEPQPEPEAEAEAAAVAPPVKRTRRATKKAAAPEPAPSEPALSSEPTPEPVASPEVVEPAATSVRVPRTAVLFQAPELFQAPDLSAVAPPRRRRAASRPAGPPHPEGDEVTTSTPDEAAPVADADLDQPRAAVDAATELPASETQDDERGDEADEQDGEGRRGRRRRRGGRGRRKRGDEQGEDSGDDASDDLDHRADEDSGDDEEADSRNGRQQNGNGHDEDGDSSSTRRRRRRRRRGGNGDPDLEPSADDPPNTVVKVRQPRRAEDEVTGLKGSTRLEAKRQRRREGRESGRRKPIVTEAEFLARRESVERVMVVREHEGRTQIAVLEDGVLVEHFVARKAQASMIGNVYLGRVQNVLPSMEAAFVDVGKGRNAVLYAGEVNWDAAGLDGQPRRIELALKSGDPVLAQVTKDPVGHKGARLSSQVSLPGRYLVYVPNGSMTGISRKLPDTERARLKKILKAVVPDDAGVIVRTAAEGASEDELQRDVARLQALWEGIEKRSKAVNAPSLLHGEPDLTVKVIRDVFNEDFARLVVAGDEAWSTVEEYVTQVAPDLLPRLEHWDDAAGDVFAKHRIDEQIAKAVERKVWLPSGGSLVIDRTEAMTVVDVNTGKFVGSGGNLEATVTKNNLEAAEEIVRQLRLRDVGGIIVIDFIDMVLESNRDLVMRRLLECLGRDRTKHQVAEVTSLGLVQMTRKRVGQGLLEAFSEPCEHCGGRGVILHDEPIVRSSSGDGKPSKGDQRPPKVDQQELAREEQKRAEQAKAVAKVAAAARAKHEQEQEHESASQPTPAPIPEPTPEPMPDPTPRPTPEPTSTPEPEPVPVPLPPVEPEPTKGAEPVAAVAEPAAVKAPRRRRRATSPATAPAPAQVLTGSDGLP